MEWSDERHRGFWASWPQIGVVGASVLGFVAIAGSQALVGPDSWWAWRLPFLASAILVVIGLYMRLGVLETPTFARLLEGRRTERAPVLVVLRRNWREVVLTALLRMGEQAPLLVFTTFFLVYATAALHFSQREAVLISIIAGVFGFACPPIFGALSDAIGRRSMFVIGAVAMGVYTVPYFLLLETRDAGYVLAAQIVAQVIGAAMAGPEAAFIAESFTGRLRYSGASLGAGLGAPIAGGAASIVSVLLFQRFHSAIPVGFYIIGCCLVSLVAAKLLRDRTDEDVSYEYDDAPDLPGATVTVNA
jgi:MFS family permease